MSLMNNNDRQEQANAIRQKIAFEKRKQEVRLRHAKTHGKKEAV